MDRNLIGDEQHELRVLKCVEGRDTIPQRDVAKQLITTVGMATALIKRLFHKVYIKVKDTPSLRYGCYVKPSCSTKYLKLSRHVIGAEILWC